MIEVHEAHEKTFHWLFDPAIVSFAEWLSKPNLKEDPIYWIQGKPGSGKSTLMKFAMRDRRLSQLLSPQIGEHLKLHAGGTMRTELDTQILQGETNNPTWTVAAFFFHDRGSEMQKTLVGMLQGVLGSILRQIPALLNFVVPFFIRLIQTQRNGKPEWDFESLQSALISVVVQRKVRVRILLLLDALDEHDGDNEQLASLLESLANKADNDYVGLKMCLASRSWTIFEEHFGTCPGFAIHEHTKSDVFTYVTSRLRHDSQILRSSAEEERLTALIQLVTDRALGVFIWVRLIVDLLVKGIRDGTPIAVLEGRARETPQELKDLYTHTLQRIEKEYTTEAYIMFQTALCSKIPLPMSSFMGSLDYIHDRLAWRDSGQSHRRGEPDVEVSQSSQTHRLASRTGGLLEIVSNPIPDGAESSEPYHVVQFIHQTVKEYVKDHQHDSGLREVLPSVLEETGNVFLLGSCAESNRSWVCCIKKYMFTYAKNVDGMENQFPRVAHLLNQIFESGGDFGMGWWLRDRLDLFPHFLRTEEESLGSKAENVDRRTFLRLAVAANLLNFVDTYELDDAKGVNATWGVKQSDLLHIAAAGPDIGTNSSSADFCQMIRILLRKGCYVNELAQWPLYWRGYTAPVHPGFSNRINLSPLALILLADQRHSNRDQETELSIARTLVESGANVDCSVIRKKPLGANDSMSALEYCVRYRNAPFVQLLIKHWAIGDSGPGTWILLYIAYLRRDREVIRMLNDPVSI